MRCGKRRYGFVSCLLVFVLFLSLALPVNAMTVYESDDVYHEEGYIVVGESHAVRAAMSFGARTAASGNVYQWGGRDDISYEFCWDGSREVLPDGTANTFTMKGNLFFVFEGLAGDKDGKVQSSYQYIYSDGKGKQGRAVEKIHEIIAENPNIGHWNIISMCGASSAGKGQGVANLCASYYRNWIDYEFPEADCYFLSVATMIKYYRRVADKYVYNRTLAAAFPNEFLDYTDFYTERNPAHLIDTIHWDDDTYIDLLTDVFWKVEQKRGTECVVTELQETRYTNDTSVIYAEPSLESNVILSFCETGLPIEVTGVTNNGFYQIHLAGVVYYVLQTGLDEMVNQ